MVADKIKGLREQSGLTQAALAKQLGVTRAGVNAWEMGISVPSTQCIVALANTFGVSTDYLLGVDATATVSVAGLSDADVALIARIAAHLKAKN